MKKNNSNKTNSSLQYPYSNHPTPGTTVELADGVHWLTMPMGDSLTHINLYLLEDDDGFFVIDTGLPSPEVKDLWFQIFNTVHRNKPVKGVICTHMQPDHIGQAGMITNHFRCPLYMTRAEYYQARSFTSGAPSHYSSWIGEEFYLRHGMPANYLNQIAKMWKTRQDPKKKAKETMMMPTAFPSGFHRLEDGDVLSIGGNDWKIVVGSGHSPEHACLQSQDLKIMLSGDQILPIITSNVSVHATEPEANPLKAWMESHDKFLETPNDTFILPAHNLPFFGVRQRLHELIEHHEDRMLAIELFCSEPRTAKSLLPVLFNRKLDPRQTMMALGEAIAHCQLLLHRNRLERVLHKDGAYRFISSDSGLNQRAQLATEGHKADSPEYV